MDVIKQRFVEIWTAKASLQHAEKALTSMQPDGTWTDVDYTDRTVGGWKPAPHLGRMSAMADWGCSANGVKADPKKAEAMRQGASQGAGRLADARPAGEELVGQPDRHALPGRAHGGAAGWTPFRLNRRKAWRPSWNGGESQYGPARNLVWLARNNVIRAVLENDAERMGATLARVWEEVRDDLKEGVQKDASFHQHGEQFYTGGYGMGFLEDWYDHAGLGTSGTPWEAPTEKVKILENYLLDGYQWAVYGGAMEPSARGRGISRKEGDMGPAMAAAADRLLKFTTTRAHELEAIKARVAKGVEDAESALVGNRHFWKSDFMAHRQAGWYASVKMTSNRIFGTESGNGESH